MDVLAVAVGGLVGAVFRYLIGTWIHEIEGFPIATLLINLLGCFLLAYFLTKVGKKSSFHPHIKLAIGTGLIGSFTTFSTFSVEALHFLQNNQLDMAICYMGATIAGGGVLTILGVKLASHKVKSHEQIRGAAD